MSMKILVFGATSGIAQATARIWAEQKHSLFLYARSAERVKSVANDLKARGAAVEVEVADLNDTSKHQDLFNKAITKFGGIDVVFLAHGELGNQEEAQESYEAALRVIQTNFVSQVSILTHAANYFEGAGKGSIVSISSVAGDRGRASNYVYGSSKAAMTAFLSGLRARLSHAHVHVCTVKPGFVDTPMTKDVKKGPLFASPERVGKGIVRAVRRRRDVVYLPHFWRLIMAVVCAIPERIFKKLKI